MEEESAVLENGDLPISCEAESDDESINDSEYDSGGDADNEVDHDDEDEEIESNATENKDPVTKKGKQKGGSGRKRKRKKKDITQRRDIRKILDESQLDKETLAAQQEEKDRLRRLELQKSLATDTSHVSSNSTATAPPCNSSLDTTHVQSSVPVIVDFRKKSKSKQSAVIVIDSDDDNSEHAQQSHDIEVISSGSGDDDDDNDDDPFDSSESDTSDIDENNVGLHSDDKFNTPNPDGSVLVNTNHPLSEDDIFLAPQIAKCVKPHQVGGIRFLYDNLVETLARFKVSAGFGCILAHSMGLGKTLQVISFTDIFLRHTEAKKVLIVVPINTIQNWMNEFDMWLPPKPEVIDKDESNGNTEQESGSVRYRNFNVYILGDSNKTTMSRAKVIGLWNQTGGVLLMGYELYRILAMSTPCMASNKCAPPKKKKSTANSNSNSQEPEIIDLEEEEKNMDLLIGIQRALCKPGPDLVICDEGHRIKNNQANISQALKKIRTRRRVVLTGYPLQNNLIEYWCMIDFVRPNFLGTRQEFSNMFERPILNGQCSDSTPSDVRLMRFRAHVLHSLLEGFVQRRSQSVLTKCLPMKEEHIIQIKLSDVQAKLYDAYINYLLNSVGHLNPIKGFHTCTKIWNHPDVFYSLLDSKKGESRNESPLTLMENEADDTNSGSCSFAQQEPTTCAVTQKAEEPLNSLSASAAWAKDIMKDYKQNVAENGGKIVILLEIIEKSLKVGEKVLVFSQSLSTLSIIEDFLSRQDIPYFPGRNANNGTNKWARNKSYFRLDGSTPSQERDRLINAFNSPDNTDVLLFMLSTRAGCLGVNLIGANRVVVFDVSWNPCHDVQAVCRVYRYGQRKHTHIYRLVSTNTMEKKIYDRQVSKQGVANRVVDELNPEANFTKQEIMSLICEKEADTSSEDVTSAASGFTDPVLRSICTKHSDWLSKVPFKHESLLVDRKELKLTKLEKREAKKGYEREKNLAQQGSRYYINPQPDTSRAAMRTVANTIPQVPPPQLAPVPPQPLITQPTQLRGIPPYLLNLLGQQNNLRFVGLNHNMFPGAMSFNQVLPNVSDTLAANIIANQIQINRALNAAANTVPNGSACRLPGSIFSGRPMPGMTLNSTTTTTQQNSNNQVVTIDLDDLPSPPSAIAPSPPPVTISNPPLVSSSFPPTASDFLTEKGFSDIGTVAKVTDQEHAPSPLPTMITNGDASINTMATTETTNDVVMTGNVVMETEQTNYVNNESGADIAEPATMATGNGTTTSSVTRPTLPLAVLQNLLNEQGGLASRPPPPEESPHSPTGASQI